jgi:hypothetical protein
MKIDLRKIPAVYMNLGHHVEKSQNMHSMLSKMGFETIIRTEGVLDTENPVAGCSKAHHKALSEFKAPFILFEDDCVLFEENFQPVIELPDDADALYLGISSWGRMNGHDGQYVQYDEFEEHPNLLRIYNMLGGHSVVYLSDFYREMCARVAYHAGYVIKNYQDIGFAEIQRFFNVYALNNPVFYQTSNELGTKNKLTLFPMTQCMGYEHLQFYPYPIK